MQKQVFLINKDLKMSSGKIAVQVAHGEVIYMEKVMLEYRYTNIKSSCDFMSRYYGWRAETEEDPIGMQKKIVLKSTESEMKDIFMRLHTLGIWSYLIFDKGLTQVAPNSLTCLVVEPLEEERCNELFGDLKLL